MTPANTKPDAPARRRPHLRELASRSRISRIWLHRCIARLPVVYTDALYGVAKQARDPASIRSTEGTKRADRPASFPRSREGLVPLVRKDRLACTQIRVGPLRDTSLRFADRSIDSAAEMVYGRRCSRAGEEPLRALAL